ncbi:DoxX family protein [Pseudomonas sp. ANT_J28]|uniref:DoxX family protein n=1 Tax=Pseudomonas sp. ANT_J28 TaxID=2597352 RepID=UPI0011F17FD3|nr:DoxX family protein [Pseudomonas sp. ANT_J28]KAA0977718.1 DoxX family protein [Pseudomonas sp. ANT_J28]
MTTSTSLSPVNRRIVWGVRALLALAFAAAGIAKLAGAPQMVQVFDAIGVGQWFRYLTGAIELTGVVLLLKPAAGFLGGLMLAVTMICGAATHLFVIGGNPAPAMVLAVMSAFVAWQLRPVSPFSAAS